MMAENNSEMALCCNRLVQQIGQLNIHHQRLQAQHDTVVTNLQQINDELMVERDELRAIFAATGAAILVLDQLLHLHSCNPKAIEQFGIDSEKSIGMPLEDAISDCPESLRELCPSQLKAMLTSHSKVEICFKEYCYHLITSAVFDLSDNQWGYVLVFNDITADKKTADSLLKAETRYSLLYETMNEGLVFGGLEYDASGQAVDCVLLDVNAAAATMLEMSGSQLKGTHLSELYPIKAQQLKIVAAVVNSGQPQEYALALPHLNKFFNLSLSRPEPGRFAAIINDITASKKAQQEIERLAYYDTLTGLPNRTRIVDRLQNALVQADSSRALVGVLAMDLDHFKKINDSLGVGYGDQLLKIIAERLRQNLRQGDSVARMGGDEFVIVFSGIQTKKDIAAAANKVLDLLSEPLSVDGHQLVCTASIGIAIYPTDADGAELLLKNADTAMYQAKEAGRNLYQFYAPEMNTRAFERLFLGADLLGAIERQELEVYYQPQVSVSSEQVVGVEALLRWNHPQRGQISPALFIPLAEESDLILDIGQWVLQQACQQARSWYDDGYRQLRVAVNLSARQFRTDLPAIVSAVLKQTQLPHHLLELELTEGLLMDKPEMACSLLNQLQQLGVQFAIDDFGTGYSSLSYLKYFPLNRLKIDRSFVKDLGQAEEDATIIEAIIALAHGLRLQVIAEGVETPEQLAFMQDKHCDEVQGFYFAKPMPVVECNEFLREFHPS